MDHKSSDTVARSERHFTATLLTHLLMCNGFLGLKALFNELEISPPDEDNSEDFEVVSELDPLRDSSVENYEMSILFRQHGCKEVPDLFLRWGNQVLVIAVKYFPKPTAKELNSRAKEQIKAIEHLKSAAGYDSCHFTYALITVESIKSTIFYHAISHFIEWAKVIATLKRAFGNDVAPDVAYCLEKLESEVERAHKESERQALWESITDIKTLVDDLPKYIERGLGYVSFHGGEKALRQASLEELEHPHYFRITESPPSNRHWVRVDTILEHYLLLKIAEHMNRARTST